MKRDDRITLEEARRTGQLKRFLKEHPSKGHRGTFQRLLSAMSQGALEAKETSQPDRGEGSSETQTREDSEQGGDG